MAKGNMLLGMSRGSVGDVTFRRVRGQQVTTARNRSPRNPQSRNQCLARLSFSSAQKLTKALEPIVTNSFQSLEYGQPSSNHFLSGASKAIFQLAKKAASGYGADYNHEMCPCVPYDSLFAVAVTTRISEGDLAAGNLFVDNSEVNVFATSILPPADGSITADNWEQYMGCSLDTQITFVWGEVVDMPDYDMPSGTIVEGIRYHIGRLNILPDVVGQILSWNSQSETWLLNTSAVDTARSSITGLSINPGKGVNVVFADGFNTNEQNAAAAAVIYSQYSAGKWRRSNSDLLTYPYSGFSVSDFQEKLGWNDINDLVEYSQTAQATKSENTFLNQELN